MVDDVLHAGQVGVADGRFGGKICRGFYAIWRGKGKRVMHWFVRVQRSRWAWNG
jgi:hypothetical protein